MARLGHRRDRHLHPVPDPPEFATFTLSELMELTEEELDQLESLRNEVAISAWWQRWRLKRAQREEVRTDVEETHDNES